MDQQYPSLLDLNDNCLNALFKYIGLDDCIAMADTCSHLRGIAQQRIYRKKFSTLKIDRHMINRGNNYIHCIIAHIGEHILSLQVDFEDAYSETNIWFAISSYCTHLKSLKVHSMHKNSIQSNLSNIACFDTVEMLTFIQCADHSLNKDIFKNFRKLRFLNFYYCREVGIDDLYELLDNNPVIESLVLYPYCPNLELLHLVPKLERLCVRLNGPQSFDYYALKFDQLKKLQISSRSNLNLLLGTLATIGILEELDLCGHQVDLSTLAAIKAIDTLQMLAVSTVIPFKSHSPLPWPRNVKHFRLVRFCIGLEQFTSMIKQMQYLENMDLHGCMINPHDKIPFNNMAILTWQIRKEMQRDDNNLNIILPKELASCKDHSKRYIFDSSRLNILNESYSGFITFNVLKVCIDFPGFEGPLYVELPRINMNYLE